MTESGNILKKNKDDDGDGDGGGLGYGVARIGGCPSLYE